MRTWLAILVLLVVACAAAWGWHALALDPGAVLVRFAGWRVETSFVMFVVLLLLAWGLLSLLWRLARWPRAAWRRRSRRRGHERIAEGLVALYEGRHARASNALERASHLRELHAPALLARAEAAHARGAAADADAALIEAARTVPAAAQALRARQLLADGRPADVIALLKPDAERGTLAPDAWRSLNAAALATGDASVAFATLAPMLRDGDRSAEASATQTLRVVLDGAPNLDVLSARWAGLSRAQRRDVDLVAAYARRAAALGQPLAAMGEIEAAQRRAWSETLADAYGALGPAEAPARLRQAEAWLDAQPNSAALLLALGRLCNQCALWGKARDYLARALAIDAAPAAWEAYAEACAGSGDADAALRAYRNALATARGGTAESLPALVRGTLDTRASVVEERSEHGVPRLVLPGK